MSERVGKTRSGQKNRLATMEITAIKQERDTRPDKTGTGAAQRMTAWGIPAEAGGEEDGIMGRALDVRHTNHADGNVSCQATFSVQVSDWLAPLVEREPRRKAQ